MAVSSKTHDRLIGAIVIAISAIGGSAATGTLGATIEDRKAVIEAQIELLQKEAQLQDALRKVAGSKVMNLPTVLSITVTEQMRVARLRLPNGVVAHYREGESIQAGMVVTRITPRQVLLAIEKGKKAVAVPLEYATSSMTGPGSPNATSNALVPSVLLPDPPDVSVPAIRMTPAAVGLPPAASTLPSSAR